MLCCMRENLVIYHRLHIKSKSVYHQLMFSSEKLYYNQINVEMEV